MVKLGLPRKVSIWSVVETIRKEEGMARVKIHTSASNSSPDQNPKRSKKVKEKADKLKAVVEKYDELPIEEYVNAVITHYNN